MDNFDLITPTKPLYHSWLIRCWTTPAVQPDQPPTWRFTAETVSGTPMRRGFETLADLLVFLEAVLADDPASGAEQKEELLK